MRKIITYYLIIGFILNFIWEMSQAGLYRPHFQGIENFIIVHLRAATGDIVILLFIYFIVALIYKDWEWTREGKLGAYVGVVFLGFMLAIIVEKYALATDKWEYNKLMPVISHINIGLAPALQLMIIAPVSLFLATKINSISPKTRREV